MRGKGNQIRGSVFLFNSCMPSFVANSLETVQDEGEEKQATSQPQLPSVSSPKGEKPGLLRNIAGLAGLGLTSGTGVLAQSDAPRRKIGPQSQADKVANQLSTFLDNPEPSLMWRNQPKPEKAKGVPGTWKPKAGYVMGPQQDIVTGEWENERSEDKAETPTLPAVETTGTPPSTTSMPTFASPMSLGRPESSPKWPESPGRWRNDRSPTDIDDEELTLECLDQSRNRPWNALHWLEVRQQLIDDGKVKDLPGLMKSVHASSARALKSEAYQLDHLTSIDLSLYLQPAESIRWFGRRNVKVPQMPAGLQSGVIEPPIIVVDQSPLDIVRDLQSLNKEERRPICVVLEVSSFDKNGAPNLNSHGKAFMTNQNDCLVRTDFERFAHVASGGLRGAKCSVRDHLAAQHDPYVVVCPNVTMFRGSRDDGYPFMERPMHITTICCSMPSSRPAVTVSSNYGTGERTEWYTSDADQTALLERLSLMGFAALQDHTHLQDCDAEKKAILILSALGCADRGLHPRDAVANSLKHWRTRFARLFHTVFLACGPDHELAEHFDLSINRQLYGALLVEDISNFAEWHWERSHCAMHINSMDFGILAEMVQDLKDEKKAEKEAKQEEERLKRQREQEEMEARQSEERERQKMEREDKYYIPPPPETQAATSVPPSPAAAPSEISTTLSSFMDIDAPPPTRQITLDSVKSDESSKSDAEEKDADNTMKRVTLLDEFSDAMVEHSKHTVKENIVDRQVDHLYKESRCGGGGMNTRKSRSHSVVHHSGSISGAMTPRMSTSRIGDHVRNRAMSCLNLNFHSEARRHSSRPSSSCSMSRSRSGSVCSRASSRGSNRGSNSDRNSGGGAGSDSSSGGSVKSAVSNCSRSSRMSTRSMARSSCVSFIEGAGRHSSSSRLSSVSRMSHMGARRMSCVERKVMQSRMSQVRSNNVRLIPTSTGHKKKELSEEQRLEQVRTEARKRLSCKKDAESHSAGSSHRGSLRPMQAFLAQSQAVSAFQSGKTASDAGGDTEDASDQGTNAVQSRISVINDPQDSKGPVLLTVVELPKFEAQTSPCVSRRTSLGSSLGSSSKGPSRRGSKEPSQMGSKEPPGSEAQATEQIGDLKSGTQPVASETSDDPEKPLITSGVSAPAVLGARTRFSLEEDDGDAISFGASMTEPSPRREADRDSMTGPVEVAFGATSTINEGVSSRKMYGDQDSDDNDQEVTLDLLDNREGNDSTAQQRAVDIHPASQGIGQGDNAGQAATGTSSPNTSQTEKPNGKVESGSDNFQSLNPPDADRGTTASPLLDPSTWSKLGHLTLTPILDDAGSRGGSLLSTASPVASPRVSSVREMLANARDTDSNSPRASEMSSTSKVSSKVSEKLKPQDIPDPKLDRTSVQMNPHMEEWQVRMDVQQLAAAFKQRTEVFWSSPSRRRKVALINPHSNRLPGRRNSNEARGSIALTALETAAEEDMGERALEAEIMRAVAATPHSAVESHPWQRHFAIPELANKEPSSPTHDSPQEALPPLKAHAHHHAKKSSVIRRLSLMTGHGPHGHKDSSKFNSHLGHSSPSHGSNTPTSPTSTSSGHAPSPLALKAVAGGSWPENARSSIKSGRRLDAGRFMSAGPILTELAKVPVDDAHKLADVSDTQELSNIVI